MGSKTEVRALLAVAKKRGGLEVARRLRRIAAGLDSQVAGVPGVTISGRELTFAAGDEVAEHASRIVAKLLARPMTKLRTAMAHGEALHAFTMTLDSLFAGPIPVPERTRAKRRTS